MSFMKPQITEKTDWLEVESARHVTGWWPVWPVAYAYRCRSAREFH